MHPNGTERKPQRISFALYRCMAPLWHWSRQEPPVQKYLVVVVGTPKATYAWRVDLVDVSPTPVFTDISGHGLERKAFLRLLIEAVQEATGRHNIRLPKGWPVATT